MLLTVIDVGEGKLANVECLQDSSSYVAHSPIPYFLPWDICRFVSALEQKQDTYHSGTLDLRTKMARNVKKI